MKHRKIDKSIDNRLPKLLYETLTEIGEALANLFVESFKSGSIPRDWKVAIVVPLYKKGSRSLPSNYRPVSLTSIVCKVMEKIIKEATSNFFGGNEMIVKSQNRFTKNFQRGFQHFIREGRSFASSHKKFFSKCGAVNKFKINLSKCRY